MKKKLLLIFHIAFCLFSKAQIPSYMDFSQYGFKQKFPSDASTHSVSKLLLNTPLIRGYSYFKQSGNGGIDAVLEIYKGDCFDPDNNFSDYEKALRTIDGNSNFFNDVEAEKYCLPFGWLNFKGTARKFGTDNYYVFYNVYTSTEYIVAVRVFLKNNDYWKIGYNINADNSDGFGFEPIPLARNLTELGIKINIQGFLQFGQIEGAKGYEFYRCAAKPAELPNFKLYLLEGDIKEQYDLRMIEFLAAKNLLLEMKTEDIPWPGTGKTKFSNGTKSLFKYKQKLENGSELPIYEIYYTFDFSGKKYLAILNVILKNDPYFWGYRESNFSVDYIGREVMQRYEKDLLKILETMQRI